MREATDAVMFPVTGARLQAGETIEPHAMEPQRHTTDTGCKRSTQLNRLTEAAKSLLRLRPPNTSIRGTHRPSARCPQARALCARPRHRDAARDHLSIVGVAVPSAQRADHPEAPPMDDRPTTQEGPIVRPAVRPADGSPDRRTGCPKRSSARPARRTYSRPPAGPLDQPPPDHPGRTARPSNNVPRVCGCLVTTRASLGPTRSHDNGKAARVLRTSADQPSYNCHVEKASSAQCRPNLGHAAPIRINTASAGRINTAEICGQQVPEDNPSSPCRSFSNSTSVLCQRHALY